MAGETTQIPQQAPQQDPEAAFMNSVSLFVSSPIWPEIKRRIAQQMPGYPVAEDNDGAFRTKTGERHGWELCLQAIEGIPHGTEPETEEQRRIRILSDHRD